MAHFSHRPSTGLKQTHKAFRPPGGSSKGALRDASKGRVNRTAKSGSKSAAQSKSDRRNTAKQLQLAKRRALVDAARADAKVPRVISIIALTEDIELDDIVNSLLADDADAEIAPAPSTSKCTLRQTIVKSGSKSTTLQLVTPSHGDLHGALDACAAADYIVLVLSPHVSISSPDWGDTFLRALLVQGVPDLGHGLRLLCPTAIDAPTRKSLLSFAGHFFPSAATRIFNPSAPGERTNLLRSLCESVPRGLGWRDDRSRVMAEALDWDGDDLLLTGHVRGRPLDANTLVHLGGLGDHRIRSVVAAPLDKPGRRGKSVAVANVIDAQMDSATVIAARDDAEADDMRSLNVPDATIGGEQVPPTEEELMSAPANGDGAAGSLPDAPLGTTPKRLKRVPKGTSDYQAAWIIDEGGDDDDAEEEDDDAMTTADAMAPPSIAAPPSDEETELVPSSSRVRFELPTADEERVYDAARQKEREQAAATDAEFPDEVDTPLDIPARIRFARYRGLQSFRTSPWDPFENLPEDYARCFRLENWRRMGKRAIEGASESDAGLVEPGQRVTVRIEGVDRAAVEALQTPLLATGLFRHEHKFSVVHFTITRNSEYEANVRSKDPLVVQLGPRRFEIRPIFSQHNPGNGGRGANNVHKFERFLPQASNVASVATCYLPITFGTNVPALLFTSDGAALIGSGTLLSCDPTRVIAKRVVLTGYPIKVHVKTATIKSMFHDLADVAYFKPVALRTKMGRTGHIRESLGTHGYFKAGFDRQLDQMDTVCLNLYKRCFPKWGRQIGAANEAAEPVAMDTDV